MNLGSLGLYHFWPIGPGHILAHWTNIYFQFTGDHIVSTYWVDVVLGPLGPCCFLLIGLVLLMSIGDPCHTSVSF